jgi:hypothetical protein
VMEYTSSWLENEAPPDLFEKGVEMEGLD